MIAAAVLIAIGMILNLFGLVVSLRLDRDGIPSGRSGQFLERRRDTLRPRIPLILVNLVGQWIATCIWLVPLEAYLPIAWPGLSSLALQLAIVALVDDTYFYWLHRWMHRSPWAYRRIHKRHHEAYAPVPLEYVYVHPAEQAMGATGIAIGFLVAFAVLGGVSAWAVWVYTALRVLHELDIHSGMRLATRHVPFLVPMRHHDRHHARPHRGNYASMFPWWDRLMKTHARDGG